MYRQWQFFHRIDQQRATLGALDPTGSGALCSGKGPCPIAEQLALEKSAGDDARVDFDQGPATALARRVNGPRQTRTPRTGLADHENGGLAAGGANQCRAQWV